MGITIVVAEPFRPGFSDPGLERDDDIDRAHEIVVRADELLFVDGAPGNSVSTWDEAQEIVAGPKPIKPDDWPDRVEARVTSAGNWGWFDPEAVTEKNPDGRVYPSWIEARLVREIYLYDEGLMPEHPSGKSRNLAADLSIYLGKKRVAHKAILWQIMKIDKVIKRRARKTLVELWQAGLVRRYGRRFNGRRLCNQEWEVV